MEIEDIFPLPPDIEKQFRPVALQRVNEWRVEILKDVPELSQLSREESGADIHEYLTDTEKASLQRYTKEIAEWLWDCTMNPNVPFFISGAIVLLPMSEIRRLLKLIYERKALETEEKRRIEAAKVAEEERKKECDRRIGDAAKALNPPLEKAESYLNADEFKQFIDSAAQAIAAYAFCSEDYVRDPRSLPYLQWLDEISARQNEYERQEEVQEKARRFNHSLNNEVTRLKAELCKEKQNTEDYFKVHIGDGRYLPYDFTFVSSAKDEQRRDAIVKREVDDIVPRQFSEFIRTNYRTNDYLLPFAEFCAADIPYLNFCFRTYAVVEIEVWLESGEITIDGYVFTFPSVEQGRDHSTYLTKLERAELLGFRYMLLTPSELGNICWKTIPLILVKGLLAGELEPEGTSIIELSENLRTYAIDNFDDEVVIPEKFADYLKELGGIDGMVDAGVIGDKVALVIKGRLAQPLAPPAPPLLPAGDASCFEREDFISTMTALGIPRKDAEKLFTATPTNLPLTDAIRLALENYKDLMSHKDANGST